MEGTPSRPQGANTTKAVKDKTCPYCHQAFTSSSLGRHLDLYIREKNPKAPDGVHDVEAIRKIRQNITRRQPKGSVARRAASASLVGAPATGSRRSPGNTESPTASSPLTHTSGTPALGMTPRSHPFSTSWEVRGVINDLTAQEGGVSGCLDADGVGRGARLVLPQRSVNRQTLKQQLEMRQQVQEAQDTSRAAELALRELLSSLRAAKRNLETDSMPFDFDPFSLDFPALTLQCLEPPPTLFASTQHPTLTSWSILPPGQSQLEALHAYFQEEFRRWKIACVSVTTAITEELTCPPPLNIARMDREAEARKAEKTAEKMEKHVYDHINAVYAIWNGLAQEQREHLWRLELARGVGRKQKEVNRLKEGQYLLKQEIANLKTQIEQSTRLQQPREFRIAPPSTVYVGEKVLSLMLEEGLANGQHPVGLDLADRQTDLNTLVSSVIDRWKNVIVSARLAASGLEAQRPLNAGIHGESSPISLRQQQHGPQQLRQQYPPTASTQGTSYPASDASATTALGPPATNLPAAPSVRPSISTQTGEGEDEDMSGQLGESDAEGEPDPEPALDSDAEGDTDADADADMDDETGEYANQQLQPAQHQFQSVVPMPAQQMGQLQVSRTRPQAGGARRSTSDGGMAGHGGLGQGQIHLHDRTPSWT
ncbi:hypothetical protein C8A03DRAFT_12266 [Achaetomium macrosporum]|uniref:Uncharacterized protein n=1 Tax=Achaetomium macrosporum TaxID=79813 RepID=A0AAN7CG75_9PEZI|nr:hypothetical protein C8A03DRAFT_12266 [Achaetomium macrosporum]